MLLIVHRYTILKRRHQDASPTGHVLGDPHARHAGQPATYRQLNGISQSLLRALTHLSLLVGLHSAPEAVAVIAHSSDQRGEQLAEFLWQHLRSDLLSLQAALGHNVEECLLTLQLLIRDLYLHTGSLCISYTISYSFCTSMSMNMKMSTVII